MPRKLRNWSFREIISFLEKHDFIHSHTKGSHFFYVKRDDKHHPAICIASHGSKSIKPKTMKNIINQSGIDIKEWLK
jgi:predicted RNA binding protein YcfA (HicA-like mRNA interferase family)